MPRRTMAWAGGVAGIVLVVAVLTVIVGTGTRIATWGDLDAHGRENLRAGREVLDDLRQLNPGLEIEDQGWTGQAGIPLATFRYPEGFDVPDDLEVPADMARMPIFEEDEPVQDYSSFLGGEVTYDSTTVWDRHPLRRGREWSCTMSVDWIEDEGLAELTSSCFPA